jgi:uncharacterized lipoprotein YehR (DUF1307 family)
MKKIMVSAAILVTSVISCKKKDSAPTCTTNMASIAGSYKTLSIKYKANNSSPEQDFFALLDACEKDDIVKLNANGSADYQDAGIPCTPNSSYTSTWSLNGNSITMDGTQGTIQLFDCKKLVVTASGALIPGDIFTVTYERQ